MKTIKFTREDSILGANIDDKFVYFYEKGDGYVCSIEVSKLELKEIIKLIEDEND